MTQGSNDLHFFYDAQGKPAMVRFNGVDYFYVYNLQGDVVAMIDANGTQVVEYYYDAWGVPVAKTGSMAATLGTVNPFRYRGYVYDEETGLYYLRSRYYNPVWKRCINSDSNLNSGCIVFSSNQFCYCLNNPIAGVDINGYNVSFGYYHNKVQDDFINNNPEVRKEVGFYKYGDSGKKGRADLVNFGTGDVWEVKPQMSGYLRNPLTYTDRALRQLQSYIEGVFSNDQNRVMLRGKNLHPGHAVQKRSFYDAQTDTDVGYWSMGDGIIWYKTTKRQHLEASRVTALDPQKEESPSYSLQPNGLVLGVLTIVYALAQSVFPPIPGFAF
ncbi:MAG: RHS repeat-associated core domain-containing protein [Christensenellales bacterium]|nr:RHS repeat-associated core domain-containing protein [Christensenellales bacterium]